MWNTVLPGEAKDTLEASDVKGIKATDVTAIDCPGFGSVEQG